ncbi:MAG: ABC transporter ATP-binding protein [Acidiferrobacterales bacterium]
MFAEASSHDIDLECSHLVKRFGDFTAVDNVSFTIPKGSFFSILGPSGCGKTTLLRMIAGFQRPDGGDILIKGRSIVAVSPNLRPVNMVFQHLALFPMMNVAENIAYGLKRRRTPRNEIAPKVRAVLERVGMPEAGAMRIDQLSGGQKQRIAIARCLVLEPTLLLLDEPLGALDLKLREHLKVELKELQNQVGTTFAYITHDQSEALVMSDHVAVMNEGRFVQVGTPQELYFEPQTAFVAGFVGDSNRWTGRVEDVDGTGVRVMTADGLSLLGTSASGLARGKRVEIFVRPESIILGHDAGRHGTVENRVRGQVESILFNGANSRVMVRDAATGHEIIVSLPQTSEFAGLAKGEAVHLGWTRGQAKCFPASEDAAETRAA